MKFNKDTSISEQIYKSIDYERLFETKFDWVNKVWLPFIKEFDPEYESTDTNQIAEKYSQIMLQLARDYIGEKK